MDRAYTTERLACICTSSPRRTAVGSFGSSPPLVRSRTPIPSALSTGGKGRGRATQVPVGPQTMCPGRIGKHEMSDGFLWTCPRDMAVWRQMYGCRCKYMYMRSTSIDHPHPYPSKARRRPTPLLLSSLSSPGYAMYKHSHHSLSSPEEPLQPPT